MENDWLNGKNNLLVSLAKDQTKFGQRPNQIWPKAKFRPSLQRREGLVLYIVYQYSDKFVLLSAPPRQKPTPWERVLLGQVTGNGNER